MIEKLVESFQNKVFAVVGIVIMCALIALAFPETRGGFKSLVYVLWELVKLKNEIG